MDVLSQFSLQKMQRKEHENVTGSGEILCGSYPVKVRGLG